MKIIATTATGYHKRFLVEISEDELANVQGESYASSLKTKPEIGMEINVSKAWTDLVSFRNARDKIDSAAETLRAVAQIAEQASAVYSTAPNEEPEQQP